VSGPAAGPSGWEWRRGTVAIRLRSNHVIGCEVANSLTLHGLMRVSIGPAISVSVRGWAVLLRWASREAAANAGTQGWHTATTCTGSPSRSMNRIR